MGVVFPEWGQSGGMGVGAPEPASYGQHKEAAARLSHSQAQHACSFFWKFLISEVTPQWARKNERTDGETAGEDANTMTPCENLGNEEKHLLYLSPSLCFHNSLGISMLPLLKRSVAIAWGRCDQQSTGILPLLFIHGHSTNPCPLGTILTVSSSTWSPLFAPIWKVTSHYISPPILSPPILTITFQKVCSDIKSCITIKFLNTFQ